MEKPICLACLTCGALYEVAGDVGPVCDIEAARWVASHAEDCGGSIVADDGVHIRPTEALGDIRKAVQRIRWARKVV